MSIVIHGVQPSPFVRKTRVFLAEKNVPYELVPQQPFGQSEEYLAISPLGKIPCLQDGDFTVPDSSVICSYLERTNPEPALYPSDPKEYATSLFTEEYADTKLAEVIGAVFFQRVVRKFIFKQEPDEEIVAKAQNESQPPVFDYLEGRLEDGASGIVGNRFGIADIAIGAQFGGLAHAGESLDAARWPKLAAYVEALHGRPSFKACLEEEKQLFASLAG